MSVTHRFTRRTALASLASGVAILLLPQTAYASPLKLWAYTKKVAGKVRVIVYSAVNFPGLTIAKRKIGRFFVSLSGAIKNVTRTFAGVVMKLKMWVSGTTQKALSVVAKVQWNVHEVSRAVIKNI